MTIEYINQKIQKFNLNNIDTKSFSNVSQIYSFTTENISGYFEKLEFTNKNVLTVAASGDHIINTFYKGAKNVIGFDINYLALIYTELKLVALEILEYEEFLSFFMINQQDNINKNRNSLDYNVYQNKLKKYLCKETSEVLDVLYEKFNNKGYELRNSLVFNNKYDNNEIKIKSNLYLKDKKEYNKAKKTIKNKNIKLINSNFKDIKLNTLNLQKNCDIILMSNISDYIKNIYNMQSNYLEKYIKDIKGNFKKENTKIVCAYLYNIESMNYRSEIDNPKLRKSIFDALKLTYEEIKFKSVMENCTDSVIIV